MLSTFLSGMFDWLPTVLGAVGIFVAGHQVAKAQQTGKVLEDVEKSNEVKNSIASADATELSSLQSKWTRK